MGSPEMHLPPSTPCPSAYMSRSRGQEMVLIWANASLSYDPADCGLQSSVVSEAKRNQILK